MVVLLVGEGPEEVSWKEGKGGYQSQNKNFSQRHKARDRDLFSR
jgi:hypothetical protein